MSSYVSVSKATMEIMKMRLLPAFVSALGLIILTSLPAAGQGDFGGFDPAQMQKRIMDGYREQLEITNDDEWKIVEQRIQKVLDARRAAGSGGAMSGMAGMARMFGRGGEPGGRQRSGGFGTFFPAPGPEEEALQKIIDVKGSNADLKAALAKFIEARQQKQAALEKAQAGLRELLSVRQEAIAALTGLL